MAETVLHQTKKHMLSLKREGERGREEEQKKSQNCWGGRRVGRGITTGQFCNITLFLES